MRLTERLRKRLEWEDKRERFLLRPFHSKFYHKHFEGYTEYKTLNEKGRMKITRIYTGQYYRQELSAARRALYRIGYVVLYILTLIGFFSGTMRNTAANYNTWVNLTAALMIPFLFWVALALLAYLFAEQNMKIADYKSGSIRLKRASMASFVLCVIRLLVLILFCIDGKSDIDGGMLALFGYTLLSGTCMILTNRLECGIVYRSIENPVQPQHNGIEIH